MKHIQQSGKEQLKLVGVMWKLSVWEMSGDWGWKERSRASGVWMDNGKGQFMGPVYGQDKQGH